MTSRAQPIEIDVASTNGNGLDSGATFAEDALVDATKDLYDNSLAESGVTSHAPQATHGSGIVRHDLQRRYTLEGCGDLRRRCTLDGCGEEK